MSEAGDNDPPGDGDEMVGYGRPPRATRFKPGQSGNSKGRPKGVRNLEAMAAAELSEFVVINENGMRKRISKRQAIVKRIVNGAVSGDSKAVKQVLELEQFREAETRATGATWQQASERAASVKAELARRLGFLFENEEKNEVKD